jgi:protein translocase SecG subunit
MLNFIFIASSFLLIILILLRIPQTDSSSQNFTISNSFLGSPKNTDATLQNFIWFLTFLFLFLVSFKTIQTL